MKCYELISRQPHDTDIWAVDTPRELTVGQQCIKYLFQKLFLSR